MNDKLPTVHGAEKELKVRISAQLHLRLHSMKVLHGKRIQDTMTEALDAYFLTHPVQPLSIPETAQD